MSLLTPTPRRPITNDERLVLNGMTWVTFPAASWDKRFFRGLFCSKTISEKEAAQLWRIFIKYRRQVRGSDKVRLLELAKTKAAPNFRKQQAEERKMANAVRKYNEAMVRKAQ